MDLITYPCSNPDTGLANLCYQQATRDNRDNEEYTAGLILGLYPANDRLCNDISYWLGANLESALHCIMY